jgi:hypothetical protein
MGRFHNFGSPRSADFPEFAVDPDAEQRSGGVESGSEFRDSRQSQAERPGL